MYRDYYHCPIGIIEIQANDNALTALDFCEEQGAILPHPLLEKAKLQLSEYFNKKRQTFDLKIEMKGTPFQKSVWSALLSIPYGKTCAYSEVATLINNPNAVRAVGAANGNNPIALIVPCHRVIGRDGSLTGYAGGLARKAWLLRHEGVVIA